MVEEQNEDIYINELIHMAQNFADRDTPEEEIREINVTDIYYKEKQRSIENDELINVQVNGIPGSGKSVLMMAEVFDTNERLGKQTTIEYILPNQIVYSQVMKRFTKRMDICIGVDEYDVMGDTGYNSTVDQAVINHFSDLHRARYIHKYACSPKDVMDKNVVYIMEVVGQNRNKKFTRVMLYVKLLRGGIEFNQAVGYVDIYVGGVLKTEFYKQYERRKENRLDLIGRYGIQNDRDIIFGEVMLDAYEDLRGMAQLGKVPRELYPGAIKIASRKHKLHNSIYNIENLIRDLQGLMVNEYTIYTLKEKIKKLKAKPNTKDAEKILKNIMIYTEQLAKYSQYREQQHAYWSNAASLKHLYESKLGEQTK